MDELTIYHNDKLINLIKENFNEDDHQLFEMSFKLFNKTQTNPNEFIINFDDIYEWIGFTKKGNAKTLLTKSFKENIDYKFGESSFSAVAEKPRGGRPSDNILLTIDCFKEFCLLAATAQSKKIYKYYIKMEKIIFKYIQEQYQEQTNLIQQKDKQLEIKDTQLEIKDKLLAEKDQELEFIRTNFNPTNNLKYDEVEKKESVYILTTDIDNVYKIGLTNNIKQRKNSLQTACVKDIDIIYDYPTSNKVILENIVHDILDYYRCKSKREHFRCNLEYIKDLINLSGIFFDTLKSTYENISRKELIDRLINKLNDYLNITDETDPNNPNIEPEIEQNAVLPIETNSRSEFIKPELRSGETIDQPILETIKQELPIKSKKYSELRCDIITWFKDNFELTNDNTNIIKVKDIYAKFTRSSYFKELTKAGQQAYNKSYFVDFIVSNDFFYKYYCAKSNNLRTFLKGWKSKDIDESESENELT